jgi:hypothetical protein
LSAQGVILPGLSKNLTEECSLSYAMTISLVESSLIPSTTPPPPFGIVATEDRIKILTNEVSFISARNDNGQLR